MSGVNYHDLADLPEDERIRLIGERAMTGGVVGFFVDDDTVEPGKADRYLAKLRKRFPNLVVTHRAAFPGVPGATFIKIQIPKG